MELSGRYAGFRDLQPFASSPLNYAAGSLLDRNLNQGESRKVCTVQFLPPAFMSNSTTS